VAMIQCDIRRGRTAEQRDRLVLELTMIVHEVTGAPLDTISAVVREVPGPYTYEQGKPSPEYEPGPGGIDLAGLAEVRERIGSGEGGSDADHSA
jgi:phenylpyruvate tautomerase PptA (4-oxalocrotonate tautomerase family)